MIVWVIAGLLGGLWTSGRMGLVNKQSVVSAAMMFALGSLAFAAALNRQPITHYTPKFAGRRTDARSG